ncbi:hypothetical protein SKAU_G00009170 [Synaphobranchus kaupii]|uniref:Uncharacterized protein n=1 Tax=Synaphobranchus kaupii TaxID=118154 RepID=A0A9Q1GAV1_SYNKA|nr:hypothetical protein SKAU_G00009170 [Synaphobranchus kaupii]
MRQEARRLAVTRNGCSGRRKRIVAEDDRSSSNYTDHRQDKQIVEQRMWEEGHLGMLRLTLGRLEKMVGEQQRQAVQTRVARAQPPPLARRRKKLLGGRLWWRKDGQEDETTKRERG